MGSVIAVDYVERTDKTELDNQLLEVVDRMEPPDGAHRSGTGILSRSTEEWGEIQYETDRIDSFKIEVLAIDSFPACYFVLLSGVISNNHLEEVWNPENQIGLDRAREEVQACWHENLSTIPGLLTGNFDNPKSDLSNPTTFLTASVSFDVHRALTGDEVFMPSDDVIATYSEEFDKDGVFLDLGFSVLGSHSMVNRYRNNITLLGHNDGGYISKSSNYSIIELTDEGRTWPDDLNNWQRDMLRTQKYFLRLIQLDYLHHWFSIKGLEFDEHNKAVRRLSLSNTEVSESIEEYQEEMKDLLESESQFIDVYSDVDYHASVAEDFLEDLDDWMEIPEHNEVGIPNQRLLSRKTNEFIQEGVFESRIEDTKVHLEAAKADYNGLYERYRTVSGQLNKLLSFQSSNINRRTNRLIVTLTFILTILTFVLIVLPIFEGLGGFEILRQSLENLSWWDLVRIGLRLW